VRRTVIPSTGPRASRAITMRKPRREVTSTAPQALALLNDPEMLASARHFAGRVLAGSAPDPERLAAAYRLALARHPSAREQVAAAAFLQRQTGLLRGRPEPELALPEPRPAGMEARRAAAWVDLCRALLNLNEFVYVD